MTRRRILLYSHDVYGLGHISRTLTIVEEVARRNPDVVQLLVTGAPKIDGFALPANADIVRLPVYEKQGLYADDVTPISDIDGLRGIARVRARIIEAAGIAFLPDLVYVDHIALGFQRELVPLLRRLPAIAPNTIWVVSLDDIGENLPRMRKDLAGETGEVLRARYDRILVRGDRDVVDALEVYGFPRELRRKSVYCGYVARSSPRDQYGDAALRRALGANEHRPLIVVAAGGGGDGERLIEMYIEMLRHYNLDAASLVITGPLLAAVREAELQHLLTGLPNVTHARFVPDLPRYLAVADLAITMGGYSTIAEIFAAGTPAVVVPRDKPWPEQRIRAEYLADRGLISMIHPDALSVDTLFSAVQFEISVGRKERSVDCSGARRSCEVIEELLDGKMITPVA